MGWNVTRHATAAALAAAVFVGSACSADDSPAPQAEPAAVSDSAARSVAIDTTSVEEPTSVLDDPSVNPEGVIVAAVLLHSDGDIDAALADGAFSRADLDAAREALADGSLDYLFE